VETATKHATSSVAWLSLMEPPIYSARGNSSVRMPEQALGLVGGKDRKTPQLSTSPSGKLYSGIGDLDRPPPVVERGRVASDGLGLGA